MHIPHSSAKFEMHFEFVIFTPGLYYCRVVLYCIYLFILCHFSKSHTHTHIRTWTHMRSQRHPYALQTLTLDTLHFGKCTRLHQLSILQAFMHSFIHFTLPTTGQKSSQTRITVHKYICMYIYVHGHSH